MIIVKVELQSALSSDRSRMLGVLTIANDGTGNMNVGNYDYAFGIPMSKKRTKVKNGKVKGYKRKRDSVFKLIAMCLKDAGYIK